MSCNRGKNHNVDEDGEETKQHASKHAIVLLRDAPIEKDTVMIDLHDAHVAIGAMCHLIGLN